MGTIFPNSKVIYQNIPTDLIHAAINIGGLVNAYAIHGDTEGQQIFRTQHDIAIDGTEYILTAGAGQGAFNFTIFDGPFTCPQDAPVTALAARYDDMRSFVNRTIEVNIPLVGSPEGANSTKLRAVFSGLITGIGTRQVNDPSTGAYYILTTVQTTGMWQ